MTAKEYAKREFPDTSIMTEEDWLRKMEEYSALKNGKIDVSFLENLDKKQLQILKTAVSVLKFADNSDYKNALYSIVEIMCELEYDDLTDDLLNVVNNFFQEN